MPPHEKKYCDWWYEELPGGAKQASEILGYTKESWDADEDGNWNSLKFEELTGSQKRAMMYIGFNPIVEKLDIWWEDTDSQTQEMAKVLGWDQQKWDEDWAIHDLPCEHKYWKELTPEEQEAAAHFGYTTVTWDETVDGENFENDANEPVSRPVMKSEQPQQKQEEEGEVNVEEEEVEEEEEEEEGDAATEDKPKKKKKKSFRLTKFFGGESGESFDHRNHRHIKEIVVTTGKIVDGLAVKYDRGYETKHGGDGGIGGGDIGAKSHTLTFDDDEYITSVWVRVSSIVQAISLTTNKDNTHGPYGGKGRPLKELCGQEFTVDAPPGMCLCGFAGRADKHIQAIAFRWGPIPE